MNITGQHDLGHPIFIIFYFIAHLENGTANVRIIIIRYMFNKMKNIEFLLDMYLYPH